MSAPESSPQPASTSPLEPVVGNVTHLVHPEQKRLRPVLVAITGERFERRLGFGRLTGAIGVDIETDELVFWINDLEAAWKAQSTIVSWGGNDITGWIEVVAALKARSGYRRKQTKLLSPARVGAAVDQAWERCRLIREGTYDPADLPADMRSDPYALFQGR